MSASVRGNPDRLEAYTETTHRALGAAAHEMGAYRDAVLAFNSASPNDLGNQVTDHAGHVEGVLDELRAFDAQPAAFAFALRNLDAFDARLGDASWLGLSTTDEERFAALVAMRLDDPFATDAEVVDAAEGVLDGSLQWPWEESGVGPWLAKGPTSGLWWTGTAIGLGTGLVGAADSELVQDVRGYTTPRGTRVDDYVRWRRGWADRMNPVARARTVRAVAPLARRAGGIAGFAFAGGGQLLEDWDDPTLTTGDRIARTLSTTAVEGGAGFAGGAIGAAIGQAVIPVPVVGAVIGGAVGGWIGGEVGGFVNDNLAGAVEDLGDGIDAGLEEVGDLASGAVELGGDVLDGIGGLFD